MNGLRLGVKIETVSRDELFNVILGAASQDPAQLQASAKRLKEMQDMFGTFDGLSEIACQRSLPLAVRQQSIIQLKNGISGHWRSRKLLSDEARTRIRTRCLTFLDEEDDTIAECNEVIISKIARWDFPVHWNSLITELMQIIESNLQLRYSSSNQDPHVFLLLRRSIKVLTEVVKEFSQMKMMTGVRTMANIVEYLHGPLYTYYEKLSQTLASSINQDGIHISSTAEDLLLAHLVYKCLVKMSVWLYYRTEKNDHDLDHLKLWLQTLYQNSVLQLKNLSDLRIKLINDIKESNVSPSIVARRSIDQLTRHVRLLGKFFRRLQQLNAARFVTLPMSSDIILYYWSMIVQATNSDTNSITGEKLGMIADSNEAVYPVRFLVQSLVLFKESLAQWTPSPKKGVPNENTLSQQFVEDAVKLLVMRFIPLSPTDLQGWTADPEEWVNIEDKENEQWEFELRPCAERVLMTLCNQYREYVVPLLKSIFDEIVALPTVDLKSVLLKEAVYCAIGRCAVRMKVAIDLNQWLEYSLIAEAQENNPNFPIIKRRIAWLIGQWISSSSSTTNNHRIWEVLVHLLQDRGPGTDAVVRLTAAVALRECVDTIDFDANVFAPYLASAVTELVKIIGEADTMESKRRIASSLNTVIERAEIRIVPLLPIILTSIPQYWENAENDNLYKGTLLNLATKLAQACKEHSVAISGLIVYLLRESMSPANITSLDEGGLLLWQAALRNTITIDSVNGAPGLIEMFPLLVSLLEVNLDLLGKIIGLLESYFLLGAPLILQHFSGGLFKAVLSALSGPAVSVNVKDLVVALNLLMQVAPPTHWGEAMHSSGLFAHLMKTVLDEETPTIQTTEILHVIARISIADPRMLLQLVSATAVTHNTAEALLFEGLMDVWWARFDNMSEPRHRKLTAMGIASLVSTGRPEVLKRLGSEISNIWMDVFCEIREVIDQSAQEGTSSPIRRFWEQDEPPSSYYQETEGTPEYNRRKALFEHDPVRTTHLGTYVNARMEEAYAVCGSKQNLGEIYLTDTDPAVWEEIERYLAGDERKLLT